MRTIVIEEQTIDNLEYALFAHNVGYYLALRTVPAIKYIYNNILH